jgi:hypothetical protein
MNKTDLQSVRRDVAEQASDMFLAGGRVYETVLLDRVRKDIMKPAARRIFGSVSENVILKTEPLLGGVMQMTGNRPFRRTRVS